MTDRNDLRDQEPLRSPRFRFTLTLESGTLIEFDIEGKASAGAALYVAQRRVVDYDLTGGEVIIGVRLDEVVPCTDYQHEGYPGPGDVGTWVCSKCGGTGYAVRQAGEVRGPVLRGDGRVEVIDAGSFDEGRVRYVLVDGADRDEARRMAEGLNLGRIIESDITEDGRHSFAVVEEQEVPR